MPPTKAQQAYWQSKRKLTRAQEQEIYDLYHDPLAPPALRPTMDRLAQLYEVSKSIIFRIVNKPRPQ